MRKYKFNVKPSDCRYIINEEKRTVVCLIEHTDCLFIHFAENNFDIPWDCMYYLCNSKPMNRSLRKKFFMPKRFWGIATCAEDDEWDVEKGKFLAFSRAKDKLNKSFFKRANLYIDTFDTFLNDAVLILNNLGEKLSVNAERRDKRIKELFGEEMNGVSEN